MKKPLAAIGLLLGLLLALTGCMKMNFDIEIKNPETADVSMVVAFEETMLGGKDVEEFIKDMGARDPFEDLPEDTVREPYAQDGYQGYRFIMKDQRMDGATVPGLDGSGVKAGLEFADGKYTFRAPKDAVPAEAKAMITEMTMSLKFPGKVLEASPGAVIDGNRVTFDMMGDQPGEFMAVAEGEPEGLAGVFASSTSSLGWIWWALGGLLVVAGALVAFLVLHQRKNSAGVVQAAPAFGQAPAAFGTYPAAGSPQGPTPQASAPQPPLPPLPPMPPAPGA